MILSNLPNLITIARILLVPLTVWLLISADFKLALGVFMLAAVSDGIDGWIARAMKSQSELGAYLDPLADKLLLVASFTTLGLMQVIPLWLVIAVISRDFLIIGGLMLAWLMDQPLKIKPLFVSKANTVAQLGLVALVLVQLSFHILPQTLITGVEYTVGFLTGASGMAYMWTWLNHMNGLEGEQ